MNEQTKAIIVSVSAPHGIFRVGNKSPWPAIKRDQENMRKMIDGQVIVVGPTTYSMLPENFSHEFCIVVNHLYSSPLVDSNNYLLCESVREAIKLASESLPGKKIFFLGGQRILLDALPFCTDAYVTEVTCNHFALNPCSLPITFFHEALSLKENRKWMIGGMFNFKEKIADLGIELGLKYTHYRKVSAESAVDD